MAEFERAEAAGDVALAMDRSVTSIRLVGDIDFAVDRDLRVATRAAIDRNLPVRVDLSAVTFLDSAGLSFVARLLRNEDRPPRSVTVVGASSVAKERLEMAGLHLLVTFEG